MIQQASLDTSINYIGYLTSCSGLGNGARTYISALKKQGFTQIHCIDVTLSTPHKVHTDLFTHPLTSMKPSSINILHLNPPELLYIMKLLGLQHFKNSYNIGVWAWESPTIPQSWTQTFVYLNEIWSLSQFTTTAINAVSPLPVITMPYAIPKITPHSTRSDVGLPHDDFIFLFNFDFLSMIQRKNPMAILQAFALAFKNREPVHLIFKTTNYLHDTAFSRQVEQVAKHLKITLIHETLGQQQHWDLLNACDCYISLHKAEGFGLGMAEAMSLGKPVIATGWSGNMDFMTVNNALLVKYQLTQTVKNIPHYPAGTLWAEPDVEHAAELMRQIYTSKTLRDTLGKRAKEDITAFYSLDSAGKRIRQRLLSRPLHHDTLFKPSIAKLEPKRINKKNLYAIIRLRKRMKLLWPYFDEKWYAPQIGKYIKNKWVCLLHYLFIGHKMGLHPHPHFDIYWYQMKNPDTVFHEIEPFEHFIRYGKQENRSPHPTCMNRPCIHFDSGSK